MADFNGNIGVVFTFVLDLEIADTGIGIARALMNDLGIFFCHGLRNSKTEGDISIQLAVDNLSVGSLQVSILVKHVHGHGCIVNQPAGTYHKLAVCHFRDHFHILQLRIHTAYALIAFRKLNIHSLL